MRSRLHLIILLIIIAGVLAAAFVTYLAAVQPGTPQRPLFWVLLGLGVLGATVVTGLTIEAIFSAADSGDGDGPSATGHLDLTYQAEAPANIVARYHHLPEVPTDAEGTHLYRGMIDGRSVLAFQSNHSMNTGFGSMPMAHTVCAAEAPDWPRVDVVPRGSWGRLLLGLGLDDGLRFDDPHFDAQFKVKTTDPEFAVLLLTPEMQMFMRERTEERWRIGYGSACLAYPGRLGATGADRPVGRLLRFLALVPEELADYVELRHAMG